MASNKICDSQLCLTFLWPLSPTASALLSLSAESEERSLVFLTGCWLPWGSRHWQFQTHNPFLTYVHEGCPGVSSHVMWKIKSFMAGYFSQTALIHCNLRRVSFSPTSCPRLCCVSEIWNQNLGGACSLAVYSKQSPRLLLSGVVWHSLERGILRGAIWREKSIRQRKFCMSRFKWWGCSNFVYSQ